MHSAPRPPAASPGASSTIILSGAVPVLVRDPARRRQLPLLLAAQVYRNLARHLSERLRAAASGWRAAAG